MRFESVSLCDLMCFWSSIQQLSLSLPEILLMWIMKMSFLATKLRFSAFQAIYVLAATTLGVEPSRYGHTIPSESEENRCSKTILRKELQMKANFTFCFVFPSCVVVEDSAIGLAAAKAAGMKCIVTKSGQVSFFLTLCELYVGLF